MSATANMILKITTLADIAGVKAAVDMVEKFGGKVIDAIKSIDDFADAHQRLSLDVSNMIQSTNGMISAMDAYRAANRLAGAGIMASASQLEGLGKKAAEYAQATGQEIPAALEQLTGAVVMGSERGLRQFGVDLDGGKDKLKNASSALDQFSAQMADVSVRADDFSDAMGALGNNLGDAFKRIMEASNASGGLASVFVNMNNALADFNTMMEQSADTAGSLARTLKGTLYEALASITGLFGDNFVSQTFSEAAGHIAAEERRNLADSAPVKQRERDDRAKAAAMARPRGGGGGGKKRRDDGMEFSVSDVEDSYQISVDEVLGGRNQGVIKAELDNIIMFEAYRQKELEDLNEKIRLQDAIKARLESMADAARDAAFELEVSSDASVKAAEYEEALRQRLQSLSEAARMKEQSEQIEQDPRVRQALLAQERKETIDYYEQITDFAGRFDEAWTSSLQNVSVGANTATAAQNLLRGAVSMVANAALSGGKITVKAVADMVKGVTMSLGIESTIRAVQELALGIGKLASSYGADPTAELHFAAAAQHAVAAALAFAVAGASSAVSNSQSTSKSAGSAGASASGGRGQYGSPGYATYGNGGQQQQSVVVILEGDAGGVFRVVEEENRKRSYSGQSAFAGAA